MAFYHDMDLTIPKQFAHLSKYEWIHNFQVKDILKTDVLARIPLDWLSHLLKISTTELNEIPFLGENSKLKYPHWPASLHDFLQQSNELSSVRNQTKVSEIDAIQINQEMAKGMNPKKLHEVSKMASLVYKMVQEASCNVVVDVGSGLGYLDHILHQKYGLKVLGMEIAQSHSSAAEKRAVQQGIICGGVQSIQCCIEDNEESYAGFVASVLSHYPKLKQCECGKGCVEATTSLDDGRGPADHSVMEPPRICMIGLHCCGDLSTTMMSYFSSCEYIRAICCVCCCYHKMSYLGEKFEKFPLSDLGKTVCSERIHKHGKPFISPSTLRLGAQETRSRWRQQTIRDHELHVNHVAFRGLLSFTDELEKDIRQKIRKCKFDTFQEFLDSFYPTSDEEVVYARRQKFSSLYAKYKKDFEAIEILTLLQVILQPVIETLIHQDRAKWLSEQGQSHVEILPVFDETISPRNLALVAVKT